MLENIHEPGQLKDMSTKEMETLAGEIRRLLIDTVSKRGGHLAPNLGMVELTLAMHKVFNSPEDKLIFDVGHQAYVHKILTGRYERFETLRSAGGLSGFPRRKESEHDAFSTGHAGTAISAALGMARARDLMGRQYSVVAVVGDGALNCGMCYEALNDAGHTHTPMIVILNDNAMSISTNVGAMAKHLTRLRQSPAYRDTKRTVRGALEKIPVVGMRMARGLERIKKALKSMLVSDQFFEALGFEYQGPVDGHDLKQLIEVLTRAKTCQEPVLLHVVTQKGRGYAYAENHPDVFHGVAPFYVDSGQVMGKKIKTNGSVMARKLVELAKQDSRIVAITAAMPGGTGLDKFEKIFPERFFDVGITEEHAVTLAAGMAASGMRPYFGVYASFLQRSYDQILHDVCLDKLPVCLMVDRAGLVGEDGATHQGVYALSYLRHAPNMTVALPRDGHELKRMVELSRKMDGPMAVCYGKAMEDLGEGMRQTGDLEVGSWQRLIEGGEVVILAVGRMVKYALRASIILAGNGVCCGVIDARFVKPMDREMLLRTAKHARLLVTLEDFCLQGGFGSMVLEVLAAANVRCPVLNLGVPDRFVEHGSLEWQLKQCGLTPEQAAQAILDARGRAQ